jgi:hypothetical protein
VAALRARVAALEVHSIRGPGSYLWKKAYNKVVHGEDLQKAAIDHDRHNWNELAPGYDYTENEDFEGLGVMFTENEGYAVSEKPPVPGIITKRWYDSLGIEKFNIQTEDREDHESQTKNTWVEGDDVASTPEFYQRMREKRGDLLFDEMVSFCKGEDDEKACDPVTFEQFKKFLHEFKRDGEDSPWNSWTDADAAFLMRTAIPDRKGAWNRIWTHGLDWNLPDDTVVTREQVQKAVAETRTKEAAADKATAADKAWKDLQNYPSLAMENFFEENDLDIKDGQIGVKELQNFLFKYLNPPANVEGVKEETVGKMIKDKASKGKETLSMEQFKKAVAPGWR